MFGVFSLIVVRLLIESFRLVSILLILLWICLIVFVGFKWFVVGKLVVKIGCLVLLIRLILIVVLLMFMFKKRGCFVFLMEIILMVIFINGCFEG